MKVNLNDKVRAKLTPAGVKHLRRSQLLPMLNQPGSDMIETELWNLMSIFASQLYNGNPHPPFEKMEIEVLR